MESLEGKPGQACIETKRAISYGFLTTTSLTSKIGKQVINIVWNPIMGKSKEQTILNNYKPKL
jgi:hypothetical protein